MPTTQRVGYVRVSSPGQNLARQLEVIGEADKTYREYQSGSTTSQRPVLREALDYVREGDTLVVASIDRLARSLRDMLAIMEELEGKGVTSSTKWRGSSEARWRSRCRGSKAMTALAVPRKQIPIGSGCVDVALGERESTWVDHLVDRE